MPDSADARCAFPQNRFPPRFFRPVLRRICNWYMGGTCMRRIRTGKADAAHGAAPAALPKTPHTSTTYMHLLKIDPITSIRRRIAADGATTAYADTANKFSHPPKLIKARREPMPSSRTMRADGEQSSRRKELEPRMTPRSRMGHPADKGQMTNNRSLKQSLKSPLKFRPKVINY